VLIWLIVAILSAIGEVLTTGLFLASVAVAAVITALVALIVPFAAVQVGVFAVLALLGVLVIRPLVISTIGLDALVHHGGEISQPQLAGKHAIVSQQVDAHGGQVRIGQGEFWTARLYDGTKPIPVGDPVQIVLIDGVTALVEPEPPTLEPDDDIDSALSSSKGDSQHGS
jgi:membrane protein implicated in regulation of membrane protease activity